MIHHRRRRPPGLVRARIGVAAILTVLLLAIGGCSGSSLGGPAADTAAGVVPIGLLVPKTGIYKSGGTDITDGFRLYLASHGGKLGGRAVRVVEADEATGGEPARAAGKKFLEADRVVAIVGGTSADTAAILYPLTTVARVPFIGTGGRPSAITRPDYMWHTSWMSAEAGAAIAEYLRGAVSGPVYAIGPDYVGGYDIVGGFAKAFTDAGGVLANEGGRPAWTPWAPSPTTNFEPYLAKIKSSGAKAVFTFYAGGSAVEFVKQYKQFGIGLPLYGAGILTEGPVLDAQGPAAEGVFTCLNYAANLDNPANREFVRQYQAGHDGKAPNVNHVAGWDAAQVLDKAVAEALANPSPAATPTGSTPPSASAVAAPSGMPVPVPTGAGITVAGVNSAALNAAISRIGSIDSPRGSWQFGTRNHTPVQRWYLRQVRRDGGQLANVVLQEVATLGS